MKPTVYVLLMENEDAQELVMGVFDSMEAVERWKDINLLIEDKEPRVEEWNVDTVETV